MSNLSTWRTRRATVRRERAFDRAIANAPAAVQHELRAIANR